MALIIENGSGVAGANAYHDRAFVTSYLTDQGREAENNWLTAGDTAQDASVAKSTFYIEQRFRLLFKGSKQLTDISNARATLTLTQQPSAGETVTIGTIVYRFVTALTVANDVLIDASKISQTIANLVDAINGAVDKLGVTIGTGTVGHPDASAQEFYGFSALIFADDRGEDGNLIATTTTVTNATWNFATLTGGRDIPYPQPLSFPRRSLFDSDGIRLNGIPDVLKFASAEYSVRAVSTILLPDPTVDATGRTVVRKKERVGPIEEETEYASGHVVAQSIRPYPAADRLLQELIVSGGRSIRG